MTRERTPLPEALTLQDFAPTSPEAWRALVEKDLSGADFHRALAYRAAGGWTAEPLYHGADSAAGNPSGFPGTAPYTRGFRVPQANPDPWGVAQIVDDPDPAEANRRLLHDLSLGVERLWLRLGSAGVRVGAGREDLDRLLHHVEPTFIEIAVDADDPWAAAAFYLDWARRRGIDPEVLRGGFGVDPVARLARRGRLSEAAWGRSLELAGWCRDRAPGLRALRVDLTPYHDGGASAVQELAAGLAAGVQMLRRAGSAGMDPVDAALQTETILAVGTDLFLEIAKVRAWKRLWGTVLQTSGAAAAIPEQRLHLLPSRVGRTVVDPWVNLLRTTVQVFVGGVTGADSVVADRFDKTRADGERDDHSRRIAINTHHVLARESGLARVADPAGGSWAVESLTERLAEDAWNLFRELEDEGGAEAVLVSGTLARRITHTVTERRREVARRKQAIVGVSVYAHLEEKRPIGKDPGAGTGGETTPSGPALKSWDEAQKAVEDGTGWDAFLQAVGADEEAVCPPLEPYRRAGPFERLRLAVDDMAASGDRPQVLLLPLGSAADARARLGFAGDFFAAGGLASRVLDGVSDAAEAEEILGGPEALGCPSTVGVVLCGSDEAYGELAVPVAEAVQGTGPTTIFLAGRPGEQEDSWRDAGIDEFIYLGCDAVAVLGDLVAGIVPGEDLPGEDLSGKGDGGDKAGEEKRP